MTLHGWKNLMSVLLTGGTILAGVTLKGAQDAAKTPPFETIVKQTGGPELYGEYCAVCHGKDARGNGPMAKELKTKVPDLTKIAKQNGGKFPFDKVEGIIGGTTLENTAHGNREMPIWGPVFSQIEWEKDLGKVRINNLTRYLQSLQVK
jgi:mono/diheme cytochrome c family protein